VEARVREKIGSHLGEISLMVKETCPNLQQIAQRSCGGWCREIIAASYINRIDVAVERTETSICPLGANRFCRELYGAWFPFGSS
jgi:hypothetical protein